MKEYGGKEWTGKGMGLLNDFSGFKTGTVETLSGIGGMLQDGFVEIYVLYMRVGIFCAVFSGMLLAVSFMLSSGEPGTRAEKKLLAIRTFFLILFLFCIAGIVTAAARLGADNLF